MLRNFVGTCKSDAHELNVNNCVHRATAAGIMEVIMSADNCIVNDCSTFVLN